MSYKMKWQVLQEFTAILHKHDLMKLRSTSTDEYEAEALSILSRFCEAAVQLADNEDAIIGYATSVVSETFDFWFDNLSSDFDVNPLALELIKVYIEAFPPDNGVTITSPEPQPVNLEDVNPRVQKLVFGDEEPNEEEQV